MYTFVPSPKNLIACAIRLLFAGRAQVPRADKLRLPKVGEAALVLHLAEGRQEAAVVGNAQDVGGRGRFWQRRRRWSDGHPCRHRQVHGSQLRVMSREFSVLFIFKIHFITYVNTFDWPIYHYITKLLMNLKSISSGAERRGQREVGIVFQSGEPRPKRLVQPETRSRGMDSLPPRHASHLPSPLSMPLETLYRGVQQLFSSPLV